MTNQEILTRFALIDSKIGKAFEIAKHTEPLKKSLATASKEAVAELKKLRN